MTHVLGVDPALSRTVRTLIDRLGENLYSCILYGSAVRGDARPGSDVNLLIVLQHSTPEAHGAIAQIVRDDPRIEPFVLGMPGLERSRCVFALKFRSIRRNYRVLHGVDVLADFNPDPKLLRFLAEQTLRNVRLRQKHAYITRGRDRKRYTRFTVRSLQAIHAALSEILRCDGIDVPRDHVARLPVLAEALGTDVSILADLEQVRRERRVLSDAEITTCHARLFRLLTHATEMMEARWPLPTPS